MFKKYEFDRCSLKRIQSSPGDRVSDGDGGFDNLVTVRLECPKSGGDQPTLEVVGNSSGYAHNALQNAAKKSLCSGCEFSGMTELDYIDYAQEIEIRRLALLDVQKQRLVSEADLMGLQQSIGNVSLGNRPQITGEE